MSSRVKTKVKVAESNYGDYSIKRTVSGLGNDVFTMSYGKDSNWFDTFKGKKVMRLIDNGDEVSIKDFSEDLNFGKIKLDYGAVFELYILLSYYFKDMKESYSEFEFVENSSISSAPATSTSAITAHNSTDETLVTDKHVLAVIQQLKDRAIAGQKKYNTNLEREDLSIQDWLQHAQEETLDFANYLQVLKEKFQ